jgi:hypothetical protein
MLYLLARLQFVSSGSDMSARNASSRQRGSLATKSAMGPGFKEKNLGYRVRVQLLSTVLLFVIADGMTVLQ